jgi:hypothetical protein
MFGRGKKKGPVANKLSRQAEPNTLSWVATDAETAAETADEEFLEDEAPEEEDEEDEATLARREAELQAELARQRSDWPMPGRPVTLPSAKSSSATCCGGVAPASTATS